ncbi:hypothetical protein, partial [Peribacillus simplex]|uniref:hypothetical protein n=1 Tax=Peribacillus simplex TaxID=1478 RepID=UPI001E57E2A8
MSAKNSKDALPHTNFGVLLKAAGLAGEKISFHKDIEIKDSSIDELGEPKGKLISIDFSPNNDEPLFTGESWANLVEDTKMNTLTAQLYRAGNFEKYSFIAEYIFNSITKGDFNILISPFASAKENLFRLNILKKMSRLNYRRFNVEFEGEKILKASCPKV